MESPLLQTIDLGKILNPKPPYECHSIRKNPDLTKLEQEEPSIFRDNYTEYIMKSGMIVYTRVIEDVISDWYDDEEINEELEIISKEDWELLPVRSDGKLAKFQKVLQQKVWEARKNGINHYHPWHEPIYHLDSMFEKIDVPQLELRLPDY